LHQVGGRGRPEDTGELGHHLPPLETRQLDAVDPPAAVQLGQEGPEPLLARLVAAVGDDQQHPLPAQVPGQER
jgi:hypothetical protein